DGQRLASASDDKAVKVWGVCGHDGFLPDRPARQARAVAPAPAGLFQASGRADGTVTVVDARTGRAVLQTRAHDGNVTATALSPEGRLLASCRENGTTVRLWDVHATRHVADLSGHTKCVQGLTFSPDGQRLVTSSPGELKVWAPVSGQHVLDLAG